MKVEPRAEPSREVHSVAAEQAKPAQKPANPAGDVVTLSGALQLADEAVRVAAISGDVRPEAVARARRLLQAGELGTNLGSLADRIIDSLLESRDHRT